MLRRQFLSLFVTRRTRPVRGPSHRGAARALHFERLDARCLLALDVLGMGVVGDSISDEYGSQSLDYAMNWVELLAEQRQINFGEVADWGEPRRQGYEYNWARTGATSASAIAAGQHLGLAGQIADGNVSHAVLAIGQNDFYPAESAYLGIYLGIWSQQQIDEHVDVVLSNIDTALETLAATDVQLVVSNIVDYGVAGVTRQFLTDANRRQQVTEVIEQVNSGIAELARSRQVPVVDNFRFANEFFGTNLSPIASQTIGGVLITNTAGRDPTNAFVEDGAHPHTVIQAGLANVFLQAFSLDGGEQFEVFSEAEMLAAAGLEYGGEDTFQFDYNDYVIANTFPWHNLDNSLDVNNDGVVAPVDVLYIINELNGPVFIDTQGWLPESPPPNAAPPFLDVHVDGRVSPVDAVLIIDFLNDRARLLYGEFAEAESSFSVTSAGLTEEPVKPDASLLSLDHTGIAATAFSVGTAVEHGPPLPENPAEAFGPSDLFAATILRQRFQTAPQACRGTAVTMPVGPCEIEADFDALRMELWFTDLLEEQRL